MEVVVVVALAEVAGVRHMLLLWLLCQQPVIQYLVEGASFAVTQATSRMFAQTVVNNLSHKSYIYGLKVDTVLQCLFILIFHF